MNTRTVVLVGLGALAAGATAFAAAMLFVPGLEAALRWRLHIEDRGYGSYSHRLHRDYLLRDASMGDDRIVVIGDSHAISLDMSQLSKVAVNYGIGGDTMRGVAQRLPDYKAARSARAIVVIAGFNDLQYRNSFEIAAAFEAVRTSVKPPIYLVSVMPVRDDPPLNERIKTTDELLKRTCSNNCHFVDFFNQILAMAPEERASLYLRDGIHLSHRGNALLVDAIVQALCRGEVLAKGSDGCA